MAYPARALSPVPLSLSLSHVLIFLYFCGSFISVQSGTSPEGSPCSTANNRIDKLSHRFIDDCDDKTFCSGSLGGSCIPKKCRTDVFPFGYKNGDVLPPLCDSGSFCPDEGGGCRSLVEVGQPCQLNQDRQCAPPPNWAELATDWNFNGSLCLGSVCSCVSRQTLAIIPITLNGFLRLAVRKICERHAWTTVFGRFHGLHLSRSKRKRFHHNSCPSRL